MELYDSGCSKQGWGADPKKQSVLDAPKEKGGSEIQYISIANSLVQARPV